MKQKKKQRRLEARQREYQKVIEHHPRGAEAFTKPGSYKKC